MLCSWLLLWLCFRSSGLFLDNLEGVYAQIVVVLAIVLTRVVSEANLHFHPLLDVGYDVRVEGLQHHCVSVSVARIFEILKNEGQSLPFVASLLTRAAPHGQHLFDTSLENHFRINVNQVVQQSSGGGEANSFLGDVAAFSATADSNGDFIQSFTEHGFIIGVCCARYNHSYQQGAERFWFRRNRFDYYMPAFANIGEQAIYYGEIYLDPSAITKIAPSTVFGYQEAWAEYRMKPNRVSGEMRSQCVNTLDYWHLADKYTTPPYLSDGWIREDPNNVDRVLTVSHSVANQIFADFYIDNKTTQPIPMYSIPATLGGNF